MKYDAEAAARSAQLMLLRLGATPKLQGYHLCVEAVRHLVETQQNRYSHPRALYADLARISGKNPSAIERNIKTMVCACWNTGNRELIGKLCYCTERPTSGTFIFALYAQAMIQQEKKVET